MFRYVRRFGSVLGATSITLLLTVWALTSTARQERDAVRVAEALAGQAPSLPFTITLAPVATSGLAEPVYLTHAGDGSGRTFVVERAGRIRVIRNGVLLAQPYLDISSIVESGYVEQGLLSVAFDPDFKTNGTFYLDYTGLSGVGDVVIARYIVSDPASDVANPIAITNLLTVTKPQKNHNGGLVLFGPNDGYLYVGLGDGGGGGDQGSGHSPMGNAQDLSKLLGKLLRINVRGVPTYTIPATNPFTQTAGARPEVWAYGLRNPWRFSFDRANGDLTIGDVGQDCFEEIDYQRASSQGGENYGWRLMEGFHQFDPNNMSNCNQPVITPAGLTLPVAEYVHPTGEAVIGGYVYRGNAYPQLRGWYFYGDEISHKMWAARPASFGSWSSSPLLTTSLAISSFGEDESGELYVVDLQGGVYKIVSNPKPPDFSHSAKQASISTARRGEVVTYSIVLRNSGGPVAGAVKVTDTLAAGLDYVPGTLTATSGIVNSSQLPTITWESTLDSPFPITLTYAVTVSSASTLTIKNIALIAADIGPPLQVSAVILVNPYKVYLPRVMRDG